MEFKINPLLAQHIQHAVKQGLGCVLAYVASVLLISPNYAVWAVISTIIAMQGESVADSIQAGILRFTGMGLGAVVGVAILLLTPTEYVWICLVLFVVTSVGAYLTRYGTMYMLASISACIILLAGIVRVNLLAGAAGPQHVGYQGAVLFGLTMIGEIMIGVAAAFLVSVTIMPVRMVDVLKTDVGKQLFECADLTDSIVTSFLREQEQLSPHLLSSLESRARGNRERLTKARRHEAYLYRYEHNVLDIQILVIDCAISALRTMLDTLNEYDEKGLELPLTEELRAQCAIIVETLRHLGGPKPREARPDLVRRLTGGIETTEDHIMSTRGVETRDIPLHRVMQVFVFYNSIRQFTEELLLAMNDLHSLQVRKQREKGRGWASFWW